MPAERTPAKARVRAGFILFRAQVVATVRLVEAWFALMLAELGILLLPRVAGWAFRTAPAHAGKLPPAYLLRRTRIAVERASGGLPWECKCLAKAMAAKMMLGRQGFASTIQLGAGRRGEELHAHAWLEAGGTIVVGGGNIHTVTPLPR